jgi:hypothetical protein
MKFASEMNMKKLKRLQNWLEAYLETFYSAGIIKLADCCKQGAYMEK